MPHIPPPQQPPPGIALAQAGISQPPPDPAGTDAEKTESFLSSFSEPHFGHFVPFQFVDATRISESASHFLQ